ncbi:unnamed protein product [Ranitomeya imitator]|uniref:Uncharacterized protein n=1 Tax=Ranitomeya imitator TaxID=111125 RepID=A0ABN9KQN3_9NEOB|nr:unnamed protein product [Ranitomeya imitator]
MSKREGGHRRPDVRALGRKSLNACQSEDNKELTILSSTVAVNLARHQMLCFRHNSARRRNSAKCSPTSKNSPLSDAGRVSPDGGTLAPAVALSWCWPPAQEDEDGRPAASAVARGCILVWCRASPGEGGAPASVVSMVRCWLVDRGALDSFKAERGSSVIGLGIQ